MAVEIFEIRDYTIDPAWFDRYRKWAEQLAVPWLRDNLDLVDFWVDDGHEAEVGGAAPVPPANGQPNVCWIIRWPSRTERDDGFAAFGSNSEWAEIWAEHPNPKAYLQTNVRFMTSVPGTAAP